MPKSQEIVITESTKSVNHIEDIADKLLIKIKPKTELKYYLLAISETDQLKEITVELGQQAVLNLFGLVLGQNRQDLKVKIILKQIGRLSRAEVKLRTLLKTGARFTGFGLIQIYKSAQKSVSFLEAKNLSLDSSTSCQVEPRLEIAANDVKASHAFSQGQIQAEQIFYLESRSLDHKQARKIIIRGFLREITASLPKQEMAVVESSLNSFV